MNNSDWLWKEVCVRLSIICHLLFAGVYGLTTDKCSEGLCIESSGCRFIAYENFIWCGDDMVCCPVAALFRLIYSSWDTTPKTPTHRERETERPPYNRDTTQDIYFENRPERATAPSVRTTTKPGRSSRQPERPPYNRDTTLEIYFEHRTERATVPSVRTTTKPGRSSRQPPTDRTKAPNFPDPSTNIPGCGRRAFVKKIRPFVVGGQDSKEHWPWMAAIHVSRNGFRLSFVCGGSLITTRHVLTAAHCFNSRERGKDMYSVLLGTSNITLPTGQTTSSGGLIIDVLNIRIHPQYVPGVFYHDIALLTLESKAPLSDLVSPVCLPSSVGTTLNSNLTLTGWGQTTFGGYKSKLLQEAKLQLIPFQDCQHSYEEFRAQGLSKGITSDMLCAGYPTGGVDACDGDSGGPLVVKSEGKWVQVGIVAFGALCGDARYPGVYTKVSTFVFWITRILSEYQHLI